MGVRVYELAKELGLSSKDMIARLEALHIAVKGHMSALDDDTAEIIRHEFAAKSGEKKPAENAATEKKTAEKKPIEKKPVEKKPAEKKHPEIKPAAEKKAEPEPVLPVLKTLILKLPVSVKDLSVKLQVNTTELIKKLMAKKIMATINQALEETIVRDICREFGFEVVPELSAEEQLLLKHRQEDTKEGLVLRPPVVTLMGHVDHGKTSLLDAIRKSNVVSKESGGITQHIGAYEVIVNKGKVTFLDTPGHEAFTAMRARGANITDIVIIVVAADDGIMPQTVEAINHAKAAGVPIVVAINKMDLPGADIERVKRQLADLDLTSEDWGGKTITVPVSAKKGTGIDHLLEMLLLEAELLELRANPEGLARGTIIESKLSKGSGPTATMLVQNGTLRVGDVFVCGLTIGKVRAMSNDSGARVTQAGPSDPVEISGLSQVPQVGDVFYVVEDEKMARELSIKKNEEMRRQNLVPAQRVSLDELFQKAQQGQLKELNIIIKADVQGSLEALVSSLKELGTKDIAVRIIHSQVGTINESDVMLAVASNAVIIGFHVSIDGQAKEEAEKKGVDVRLFRIIYDVINAIRLSMEGLLEPTVKETFAGRAKVLQIFKVSDVGKIAGCMVVKGKFARSADLVRLFRKEECLFEGKLESLKRYKDDVKEVGEGMECGIGLANFSSIEPDDIIECYRVEKIARKL